MGAVQLGFSGGEPLVRQDLEQLVAHAHQQGFYTNLITSGIGLTEQRIADLKQAGLDHIQVSFQASDPVVNDALAGSKHALNKNMKCADWLRNTIIQWCLTLLFIDITLTKLNKSLNFALNSTQIQSSWQFVSFMAGLFKPPRFITHTRATDTS